MHVMMISLDASMLGDPHGNTVQRHIEYANEVAAQLRAAGLRVDVDDSSERMNKKIRNAQLMKIPYLLVVGDKEAEDGAVAVRTRDNVNHGATAVTEFVDRATTLVTTKSMAL